MPPIIHIPRKIPQRLRDIPQENTYFLPPQFFLARKMFFNILNLKDLLNFRASFKNVVTLE